MSATPQSGEPVDVLIDGAGPTGLALAALLTACEVRPRIVQCRGAALTNPQTLALHPRTLELLSGIGVTGPLLDRGTLIRRLCLHAGGRAVSLTPFGTGSPGTAYPFLLLCSREHLERTLTGYLAARGVEIEHDTELFDAEESREYVTCMLRRPDRRTRRLRVRYLVGCDGRHGVAGDAAHVESREERGPWRFLAGDVRVADGPRGDEIHVFTGEAGLLLLHPLTREPGWRLLVVDRDGTEERPDGAAEPGRGADRLGAGTVQVTEVERVTRPRPRHRVALRYRHGRILLAGDAAHTHDVLEAQGVNVGVGDAWNLGWKLALVVRGAAGEKLLETYETERRPVADAVPRHIDRALRAATSPRLASLLARSGLAPHLAPLLPALQQGRRSLFRGTAVAYHGSPDAVEGEPRLRGGPRAGERMVDAEVIRDGTPVRLHEALAAPRHHLLLCGRVEEWGAARTAPLLPLVRSGLLMVHRLAAEPSPGTLCDARGTVLAELGVARAGHYLVRPDGHVAYRAAGTDLTGVRAHLADMLPGIDEG
ncbi:FAD-dependent oxidoreductase [Marinactinospora endophytica]